MLTIAEKLEKNKKEKVLLDKHEQLTKDLTKLQNYLLKGDSKLFIGSKWAEDADITITSPELINRLLGTHLVEAYLLELTMIEDKLLKP